MYLEGRTMSCKSKFIVFYIITVSWLSAISAIASILMFSLVFSSLNNQESYIEEILLLLINRTFNWTVNMLVFLGIISLYYVQAKANLKRKEEEKKDLDLLIDE
jgi:Na+/serine symporter